MKIIIPDKGDLQGKVIIQNENGFFVRKKTDEKFKPPSKIETKKIREYQNSRVKLIGINTQNRRKQNDSPK